MANFYLWNYTGILRRNVLNGTAYTLSVKSPDVLSNKSDVAINVAFMQIVMCMLVPRPQFLETYSGKKFRSGVTLPGHASRTMRTNITAGRDNEKRFINQDI